MTQFLRIDDHRFFSRPDGVNGNGRILNVKSKSYSRSEYKIARMASEQIGNRKSQTFTYHNRKWKVVRVNDNSLFRRILRHLFPFSLKPAQGRFEQYEVKRCFFSFGRSREVEPEVYASKIHESLHSFTRLAARANQRYEPNFNPKDTLEGDPSAFVMILQDGKIHLVKKNSVHNEEGARNAALDRWQLEFIAMYGQRKFDQIVDFYRLDFSQGLTPELIYRANIGATNIEYADLLDLVDRLKLNALTLRERNRLRHAEAFKKKLIEEGLTPDNFSTLCALLEFSSEEKERAYTGKKIALPISTSYTMADTKKYKPWIDQQELLQISEKLKACKTIESYQELLAHVVVKKHLLRVDSDGPRLGAILPFLNGTYVAVTHCISNGANLCYTLESPVREEGVPTVLLFRSTATEPYAINWSDTIVNDFNHMNSPGYLGAYMIDPYMRAYLKERTIPLWVGYLYQATQGAPVDEEKWLNKAVEALGEEIEKKNPLLDFGSILKKHDQLLNTIFYPFMSGNLRNFISRYRKDVLANMINKYVYNNGPESDQEEILNDANRLKYIAEKIIRKKSELYPALASQAQELLKDLKRHIFEPNEDGLSQEDHDLLFELSQAKNDGNLARITEILNRHAEDLHEDIGQKKSTSLYFTGQSLGGGSAQRSMAQYMAQDGRIPLPDRSCRGFFFQEPGINREDVEAFRAYGESHQELFAALGLRFSIFKLHEAGDFVTAGGEMGLGAVASKQEQKAQKAWLTYYGAVISRSKLAQELNSCMHPVHAGQFLSDQASPRPASVKVKGSQITRTKSTLRERDYTKNEITPYVEGLYNLGSMGKLEGDEKDAYKKLYSTVWELPARLEPVISESARKSTKLPFMIFRKTVNNGSESTPHTLPKPCLDANGVLAWGLEGMIPLNA